MTQTDIFITLFSSRARLLSLGTSGRLTGKDHVQNNMRACLTNSGFHKRTTQIKYRGWSSVHIWTVHHEPLINRMTIFRRWKFLVAMLLFGVWMSFLNETFVSGLSRGLSDLRFGLLFLELLLNVAQFFLNLVIISVFFHISIYCTLQTHYVTDTTYHLTDTDIYQVLKKLFVLGGTPWIGPILVILMIC